jgi:hypothetical protein
MRMNSLEKIMLELIFYGLVFWILDNSLCTRVAQASLMETKLGKQGVNQQLELQREKEMQMTKMTMKVVAMNQPARKR